jgi:hypothetical protein
MGAAATAALPENGRAVAGSSAGHEGEEETIDKILTQQ